MDIPIRDVPVGRFFATSDQPPNNVYIMRAHGRHDDLARRYIAGSLRKLNGQFVSVPVRDDLSLAQNINDGEYCHVEKNRLVRLIREDEQDQTTFHV